MSLQYLKEEVIDEVYINTLGIIVSFKVVLLLMGMFKHSQSTQSSKFAISLQYPKEKVRNGVFCM